jgi:DNA-binding CsgD family transcriptional regulator
MRGSLTRREMQSLAVYARTNDMGRTATALDVSPQTIKNHLHNAYDKLEADGAIAAFRRLGWLVIPGDDALDAQVVHGEAVCMAADTADRLDEAAAALRRLS